MSCQTDGGYQVVCADHSMRRLNSRQCCKPSDAFLGKADCWRSRAHPLPAVPCAGTPARTDCSPSASPCPPSGTSPPPTARPRTGAVAAGSTGGPSLLPALQARLERRWPKSAACTSARLERSGLARSAAVLCETLMLLQSFVAAPRQLDMHPPVCLSLPFLHSQNLAGLLQEQWWPCVAHVCHWLSKPAAHIWGQAAQRGNPGRIVGMASMRCRLPA